MFMILVFVCLYATSEAYQHQSGNVQHMEIGGNHGLGMFKYVSCNTGAPINFTRLIVGPDPIQLGKPLTIDAEVNITTEIKGDIDYKANVTIKIGDSYSSLCDLFQPYCEGKDVCSLIKKLSVCPQFTPPLGKNCLCPFEKNLYSTKFLLPLPSLSYEISGEFKVYLELWQTGKQLMCMVLDLCIGDCH